MKQNFVILDGIRGIAAIFVLILHTDNYWGGLSFFHSHLAVDAFFILSGYVIAHAYENKLANGQISLKDFMVIRLIRLYPMFFISVFVTASLAIWRYTISDHQDSGYLNSLITSIGLTFLLLPSVLSNNISLFPLNGTYWSIFYELVINLFYAAIRPILSNKLLVGGIGLLAILLCMVASLNGSLGAGFTWRYTSIITGLTRSGFGILLGIYLYRVGKSFKPNITVPTWLIISLPAIVLMMPDFGVLNSIFELFAVFIIFPFSIVFGARCYCNQMTSSVFKVLGQASYPIYLLHIPIASLIYSFGFGSYVERFAPVSGILFVILMILLSLIVEKFYDLPLRKYLTKRLLKLA